MGKITIKDIARLAGVSPSAVSFALNNKPGISNATRQKILEIIKQTGFTQNINSLRLSHQRSYNISVIVHQDASPFEDLFFYSVAKGLMQKNKEYGYNIVFSEIIAADGEIKLPKMIERWDTDGIVFLHSTLPDVYHEINKTGIPYVVVDSHEKDTSYVSIYMHYEMAAQIAVNYLIKCGHKDIGFISKIKTPPFYAQTYKGFSQALQEANLPLRQEWIEKDAFDEKSAYECMGNIMRNAIKPTAIFCAVDIFAIGAMRWAQDNGFSLPDDLSFCGIDNNLLGEYFNPKLTTIDINKEYLGEIAMELIEKQIRGEMITSVEIPLGQLLIRDSVKIIKG